MSDYLGAGMGVQSGPGGSRSVVMQKPSDQGKAEHISIEVADNGGCTVSCSYSGGGRATKHVYKTTSEALDGIEEMLNKGGEDDETDDSETPSAAPATGSE